MRILIAEDHSGMREILEMYLSRLKFVVDVALNGQEAFEMAQQHKYDAMLLDLRLPQKSGYEVITGLRCLRNQLPILVISAQGAVESRVKALNLGADDYLVKDIALPELGARLNRLIRRADGGSKNLLFCNNLTLDMADMTVRRKSQSINLTKKEFIILSELLRKKNKVVTIEDLMEAAWGEGGDGILSNKLNVHMRSLRQKVDIHNEKPLIKTVRGFGYKITDR
jgi:DNA-binding response OmpR family regulator